MLKGVKALQLTWSVFLLTVFIWAGMSKALLHEGGWFRYSALAAYAAVYVAASYHSRYDKRTAWRLALFLPVVPLAMHLPGVLMNIYWCATGDELYQDSPATIIIVLMKAVLFVVPPLFIYYRLFTERKVLMAILFETAEDTVQPQH